LINVVVIGGVVVEILVLVVVKVTVVNFPALSLEFKTRKPATAPTVITATRAPIMIVFNYNSFYKSNISLKDIV
jgi:hypothetical protein|tara:strand:- start:218 stop:439 length:222 start_codon:yes stop_codon:yes gene_type:complete